MRPGVNARARQSSGVKSGLAPGEVSAPAHHPPHLEIFWNSVTCFSTIPRTGTVVPIRPLHRPHHRAQLKGRSHQQDDGLHMKWR